MVRRIRLLFIGLLVTTGHSLMAEEPNLQFVVDALQVEVTALEDDVYRVAAQPLDIETRTEDEHAAVSRAGNRTEFVLDRATGAFRIVAKQGQDTPLWRGSLQRIHDVGRMHVDGLELEWDARPGEHIYGLGQRFDALDQNGKHVEMWIRDAVGQSRGDSYYCTPVLFGLPTPSQRSGGPAGHRGYALFASDNPEGSFDFNTGDRLKHRYRRTGQHVSFFLAIGPDLKTLVRKRAALQGPFRGLPDWAWGPWISRNSFESQAEAEEAIQGMLERKLPVAAIVQEAWKGSSESGGFNTFSRDRWPTVEAFLAFCAEHDIRNVLWQVPIIHPSSPAYREGVARGYFVKNAEGQVSHREEWLAGFANIDFTNPDAVAWWKDRLRGVVRLGAWGFKADDGEAIKPDDVFSDGRRGWQVHNEYSTLYNQALTELFDEEGVDGMLWARSGSLGIEQYPALWAGDQYARWEQYRSLLPAGLSAGLSGMPFWGHDIGGYIDDPGPELYIRWLQFGAFSPLMQYHGIQRREPWEFGETAEQAYRLLSHLRMNLRPTLIALGREAAETGLPLMRPMLLEFPDEPVFADEQTQYMLGPDLLVAPVLEEGAVGRRVQFPKGRWHHLLRPIAFDGPGEFNVPVALVDAPVFVREGAALRVELDEDADLGTWHQGAPIRTVVFESARAAILNPRIPLSANILSRRTPATFEVPAGFDGELEAGWCDALGHMAQLLPVHQESNRRMVDLELSDADAIFPLVKTLAIRRKGEDATFFRASIRWQSPTVLTTEVRGSRVVASGRRAVTATVQNRSDQPLPLRLEAHAVRGASVQTGPRDTTLAAGITRTWTWQVDVEDTDLVGDIPVTVSVFSGKTPLAQETVHFVRPLTWAVVGPFPAGPHRAFATSFPPEWEPGADVAFEAGNQTVRWERLAPDHVIEHGGIDFVSVFGQREDCAAYAMSRIRSEREQDVELRLGSDDTLTVWLNGEKVYAVETYRLAEWDQEVVPVRLRKGVNTLIVKVGQDRHPWKMFFRVTAPGGRPVYGLTDGFDDIQAYAADRPAPEEVIVQPAPLTWCISGAFPYDKTAGQSAHGVLDSLAASPTWPIADGDTRWRWTTDVGGYDGTVDLNTLVGPITHGFSYAATRVNVDTETPVELVCGSDDGMVMWVNGEKVLEDYEYHGYRYDQHRVRATLRAGENVIFCRIGQGDGEWKFRVVAWDLSGDLAKPLPSSP